MDNGYTFFVGAISPLGWWPIFLCLALQHRTDGRIPSPVQYPLHHRISLTLFTANCRTTPNWTEADRTGHPSGSCKSGPRARGRRQAEGRKPVRTLQMWTRTKRNCHIAMFSSHSPAAPSAVTFLLLNKRYPQMKLYQGLSGDWKGSENLHNISTNKQKHTRTHGEGRRHAHLINFKILCGLAAFSIDSNWFDPCACWEETHFIVMILAFGILWKFAILWNPITQNCQAAFNLRQSNVRQSVRWAFVAYKVANVFSHWYENCWQLFIIVNKPQVRVPGIYGIVIAH